MRRLAIFAIALALVALAVACGGGGSKSGRSVASPSPPAPTATLEANVTPGASPLLDDVINLAVQLNTMTREQATCVFGHEDILQEFLRITGLNKSGTLDEAKIKQQFGDLIRKYPVQFDNCFNSASG